MRRDQTGLPQSGRRGYIRKLLPKPFLGGLYCILKTRMYSTIYAIKHIKEDRAAAGDQSAGDGRRAKPGALPEKLLLR